MPVLRRFHLLALLLPVLAVSLGWIAVVVSSEQAPVPEPAPWVRTVDGWERAVWLTERHTPYVPPLHPAVVTGTLLATAAFVLASGQTHGASSAEAAQMTACSDDRP